MPSSEHESACRKIQIPEKGMKTKERNILRLELISAYLRIGTRAVTEGELPSEEDIRERPRERKRTDSATVDNAQARQGPTTI